MGGASLIITTPSAQLSDATAPALELTQLAYADCQSSSQGAATEVGGAENHGRVKSCNVYDCVSSADNPHWFVAVKVTLFVPHLNTPSQELVQVTEAVQSDTLISAFLSSQ